MSSEGAPKAIGPYSQAVRCGDFLFVSGQIPLDPATGQLVPGGIEEQAHRVMRHLQAVLAAGDATFDHVVRSTIYLTDLGDFATVNGIYGGYFGNPAPARVTVQVARLPRDAQVEIDAIAYLGQ